MLSLHRRQRFHLCPILVGAWPLRGWSKLASMLCLLLLTPTWLIFSFGGIQSTPLHAAPLPQSIPVCDTPTYHGIQHCAHGDVHTVVVDLTDPHVRVQTVLSVNSAGIECNSVNPTAKDATANCPAPYPFETLASMLARYKTAGAVAAINTDYFGCGGTAFPCGSSAGDHGAQGLAVRNGIRLDGPAHDVTNDLAFTTPSLAVSPLNLVTIGIPGSQAAIDTQLESRYYNTVGGSPLLIEDGVVIPNPCSQPYHAPYGDTCNALPDADGNIIEAQSAGAISGDGTKLVLATAGLNAADLATYLVTNGPALTAGRAITSAVKFDGGGSARLAWLNADGNIAAYSPTGQNRPIAEALLIFSDKIATAEPGIMPQRLSLAATPGQSTKWDLTVSTGAAPIDKGDVLLVFDRTGSMGDEIAQVKLSALDIMNTILDRVPNTWFGVAGFMDYPGVYSYPGYEDEYGSAEAGDLPWALNLQPTADIVTVAEVINTAIQLGNGGDDPESYTRMLSELPKVAWRSDVKKIAVVFGDAPAHDLNYAGQNWGGDPGPDGLAETTDDLDFETMLQQVRDAGISIIAVNSLNRGEDTTPEFIRFYDSTVATFRGMSTGYGAVSGTGGQYFELTDAAQIPLVTTNLILAESLSVDELSLRVTEGFEAWVTVTPEKFERVGANAAKDFAVTITPPAGTPAGFYPFLIQAIGDGAILGATPVEVTIPTSGSTNDTGFRPNPNGYRVASGSSMQTWDMFRQFFGQSQVEYSNGNRLHATDRFFTQFYANAGNGNSATGFATTSMINFLPNLVQPNAGSYAMPPIDNLFGTITPSLAVTNAIAFAQGIPLGLEIGFQKANLCTVMEKSPAAMFFALRAQLQAGNPPVVSLFQTEPTADGASGSRERTLLPYRIDESIPNQATVYVYDPAYPGSDTQALEFRWTVDRVIDEWRYATPNGIWQGNRSACLLAITPLSLFTHAGVAWWKAGPSWPPTGTATATAAANMTHGTAEPPAVRLYRVYGPATLLIVDRTGQRLGFAGATFYDEIAGATFVPMPAGASPLSGLFYLPTAVDVTAQLIATGAGDATLHILGEAHLLEVTARGLVSGTVIAIALDKAGEGVSVTALNNAITGTVSINRLLTAEDRTVQIGNLHLQANDTVSFTFQPAQLGEGPDNIILQTENRTDQTLSLSLQRSGESIGTQTGYSTFGVDELTLTSDATMAVQLDNWVTPTQVTLVITDALGNVTSADIVTNTAVAATVTFESTLRELRQKGDHLPITVAVRDQFGAFVADGTAVTMHTTLGSLSPVVATTVNGRITTTLTYDESPGTALVTAQVDAIQAALSVTFRAPTDLPDEGEPDQPLSHETYLPFIQR